MRKEKIIVFVCMMLSVCVLASGKNEVLDKKRMDLELQSVPFKQSMFDYPGNVTVITRKDIEDSNAKFVYDLLRREPGITVMDYTHAGKTVKVDMRGFGETAGSNVLVLIDGRRINEIDTSGIDWAQIPIETVERIEVIRGAGSVLYGDNASSGVINIVTRKGEGTPTIKLGTDFGGYRYQNYYSNLQGSDDFASYFFTFNRRKTDGYRLNGDYDGLNGVGNMTIFPSDNLKIDLSGGYHKDWYGLPGGLQRTEIDQLGRKGSTTPNDRAHTETGFFRISPEIKFDTFGAPNVIEMDFWARKKRNNSDFASSPQIVLTQIDSIGGSIRYVLGNMIGKFKNAFMMGCDFLSAKNRMRSVAPWETDQLQITKETLGVYACDKLEFDEKFVVSGGIRQEWAEYRFDQWNPVNRYVSRDIDQEAFDVGAEFKYAERGVVYGRFSRSYRYPATDEYYSRTFPAWGGGLNTDLKHQVADAWEVGIKEQTFEYLKVNANFFFMDVNNEIFYDPVTNANSNYHHTQHKGVELGVRSSFSDYVDLFCNYTYTNAYFVEGRFAGNKIPAVPENKVDCGFSVRPYEWIEMNFDSTYVGKQYPISDQFNRQPQLKGHFICNGKLTLRYKRWEAYFGVNNIFNKKYSDIAVASTAGTVVDLYPAPERSFEGGVSVRF